MKWFLLILLIVLGILALSQYFLRVQLNVAPIDWQTLQLPASPNFAIRCHPRHCPSLQIEPAPVFLVPRAKLQDAIQAVISQQDRTKLLLSEHNQQTYVQYTRFMHYPDLITIEVFDLGNGQSTLAIFSRAVYGYHDFGVNQQRAANWLERLQQQLDSNHD